MNKRIIHITRGLPACGKSTFSKDFVVKNKNTKRISRDDLRHMLNGYDLTWENQAHVLQVEREIFKTTLLMGFDIISDNTYIREHEMIALIAFINEFEEANPKYIVHVRLVDFTDVPLELCIQRDSERPRPTGEGPIRDFHNIMLSPENKFMDHYYAFLQDRESKQLK